MAEVIKRDVQLTDKRNQRDALYTQIRDRVKWCATVKGIYGNAFCQYEMVGGTRLSERKPSTRKKVGEFAGKYYRFYKL